MLEDVGEISEILGRSYGMPDGIEEEDLDAELACLEDELESEALGNTNDIMSSEPQQTNPAYLNYLPENATRSPQVSIPQPTISNKSNTAVPTDISYI